MVRGYRSAVEGVYSGLAPPPAGFLSGGPIIPPVPPPKRHPYDQWSPDARALDLVGDKWTLLIIRDLAAGPRRFVELQRVLPGISTEQLRSRLNRMVADGLLTRQRYREVPPRVDYELTERSRELMPVLGALARWGYDWTWTGPRGGEDINVGAIFRLAPGLLSPPPDVAGTVDLVLAGEHDEDRTFRLSAEAGQRDDHRAPGGAARRRRVRVRGGVDQRARPGRGDRVAGRRGQARAGRGAAVGLHRGGDWPRDPAGGLSVGRAGPGRPRVG